MNGTAIISLCGRYRHTLTREWHAGRPRLLAGMMNPSDADAHVNDMTVTLLTQIADHHQFGSLSIVNLCPLRCSDMAPAITMLKIAQDDAPHSDEKTELRKVLRSNLDHVATAIDECDALLLAWGAQGGRAGDWYQHFMQNVRDHIGSKPVYRLGVCANGHPMHPMARGKHRIKRDAPLIRWTP